MAPAETIAKKNSCRYSRQLSLSVGRGGPEINQKESSYPLDTKALTPIQAEPFTTAKVQDRVHGPEFPPDLQEIVDCWNDLPEQTKASIMILVRTAKHS